MKTKHIIGIMCIFCLVTTGIYAQIGFTQKGIASFYANKFHGRKTSSGEKYDKKAYTAAHRELPFGSIVKVENLKTGKSLTVRINDRGPFRPNRIIDLSLAAAKDLGIVQSGLATVQIEVIGIKGHSIQTPEKQEIKPIVDNDKPKIEVKKEIKKPTPNLPIDKPKTLTDNKKPIEKKVPTPALPIKNLKTSEFTIQLGKFSTLKNANELCDKANKLGYTNLFVNQKAHNYVVYFGNFKTDETARKTITEIEKKGLKGFVFKNDKKVEVALK